PAGLSRLHPRSVRVLTTQVSIRRENRCERPYAPCLRAPQGRCSRTQTRRTPPTRPAPRPARTQMYRTDQAVWCAEVSRPRASRLRLNPHWLGELGQEFLARDFHLAYAAYQEIAVVVDVTPYPLLARQPLGIAFRDDAKSAFLPGINRDHEMARKA